MKRKKGEGDVEKEWKWAKMRLVFQILTFLKQLGGHFLLRIGSPQNLGFYPISEYATACLVVPSGNAQVGTQGRQSFISFQGTVYRFSRSAT